MVVHECFASTKACGNLTSNVGCKPFPKRCKNHWQLEEVQLPTACHRAAGRHIATNEVIVPTMALNTPYHACYADGLARPLTSRVGCRRHRRWRGQSRAATAAPGLRHSIATLVRRTAGEQLPDELRCSQKMRRQLVRPSHQTAWTELHAGHAALFAAAGRTLQAPQLPAMTGKHNTVVKMPQAATNMQPKQTTWSNMLARTCVCGLRVGRLPLSPATGANVARHGVVPARAAKQPAADFGARPVAPPHGDGQAPQQEHGTTYPTAACPPELRERVLLFRPCCEGAQHFGCSNARIVPGKFPGKLHTCQGFEQESAPAQRPSGACSTQKGERRPAGNCPPKGECRRHSARQLHGPARSCRFGKEAANMAPPVGAAPGLPCWQCCGQLRGQCGVARWSGLLAVAAQRVFAAFLLEPPLAGECNVGGDAPEPTCAGSSLCP